MILVFVTSQTCKTWYQQPLFCRTTQQCVVLVETFDHWVVILVSLLTWTTSTPRICTQQPSAHFGTSSGLRYFVVHKARYMVATRSAARWTSCTKNQPRILKQLWKVPSAPSRLETSTAWFLEHSSMTYCLDEPPFPVVNTMVTSKKKAPVQILTVVTKLTLRYNSSGD